MQNQLKIGLFCALSMILSACGQTGALTLAKEGEYDSRSQYLIFKPQSEKPQQSPASASMPSE